MNNPDVTEQPATPTPVACSDLLAALREYENKHPSFMRIPHLRLFCDGSGALVQHDVEMFTFHDINHLFQQLKAANSRIERLP